MVCHSRALPPLQTRVSRVDVNHFVRRERFTTEHPMMKREVDNAMRTVPNR